MSTAENDRRELGGRSSSRRAIAESHSVARKQEASKFSSRRGALVEGNDLYRAKMGVTEAREIAHEICARDRARDCVRDRARDRAWVAG